jgi:thiopurine S-methyltransferase
MDKEFWLERWAKNEIGFHRDSFNSVLLRYESLITQNKIKKVFLPLCGKSLDLLWWAQHSESVWGVEFSDLACKSFFEEHQLPYRIEQRGSFQVYKNDKFRIFQGDFFNFENDHEEFDFIFDRASNIALPLEMRKRYYQKMNQLFSSKTQLLLVTIEYPQDLVEGPPFSVTEEEIMKGYAGKKIDRLSDQEIPMDNPKFKDKAVTVREKVYLIRS